MSALAVFVAATAVLGWGVWYIHHNFDSDPRVQAIMDVVQRDSRAADVLGRGIRVTSMESHDWQSTTGMHDVATYTLHLEGSTAAGTLKARLDVKDGQSKVILMILTGPDGHPHTLVGHDPDNPFDET